MSGNESDKLSLDFEIDHKLSVPEPFDIGVADLKVRNVANAIGEGLDLEVTANFGSDYVTVKLDDGGTMEVLCSIYEAHIATSPFNCHFTDIDRPDDASGFEYDHSFNDVVSSARKTETGANASGDLNVDKGPAKGRLSGKAETSASFADDEKIGTQGSKKTYQVQFGPDDIRIRQNPDDMPLDGALVDRARCLRVAPIDKNKPYGVVLRLRVKRSWMQLSDAKPVSLTGKLSGLMKSVFSGTDASDEYHREAFKLLLDHLVFSGLQSDADDQYATFAARAIRAVPSSSGDQKTGYIQPIPLNLTLPVDDLETVLSGTASEVRSVLHKYGLEAPDEKEARDENLLFVVEGFDGRPRSDYVSFSEVIPASLDEFYLNSWMWNAQGPFAGRDSTNALFLPNVLIRGMMMRLHFAILDRASFPVEFVYSELTLAGLEARYTEERHDSDSALNFTGAFNRITGSLSELFKAKTAVDVSPVSPDGDNVRLKELTLVLEPDGINIYAAERDEGDNTRMGSELVYVKGVWVDE